VGAFVADAGIAGQSSLARRRLVEPKQHHLEPVFQKLAQRPEPDRPRALKRGRVDQLVADIGARFAGIGRKGNPPQIGAERRLPKAAPQAGRIADEQVDADAVARTDNRTPFGVIDVAVTL